jgi:hypothetical protein
LEVQEVLRPNMAFTLPAGPHENSSGVPASRLMDEEDRGAQSAVILLFVQPARVH